MNKQNNNIMNANNVYNFKKLYNRFLKRWDPTSVELPPRTVQTGHC